MEQREKTALELLMLKDLLRMQVISQTVFDMAVQEIQQSGDTPASAA